MEKNEPLLADVRAPWDSGWKLGDVLRPKNFWRALVHSRRYRGFWAPGSMDVWRYRRLLRDLDDVCLRSLRSHGALTARELADWLNREELLRTKPELTGIHRISAATAHDWIGLARRRGYVAAWQGEAQVARSIGSHWGLTEQGERAIHSKPMAFLGRLPYGSLVPLLITGGGLVAALNWLGRHPTAILIAVYLLLAVLEIAAITVWFSRSEKRTSPGIAVVAIETLRSVGKPLPAL